MEIERTALPGIGLQHAITTTGGRRVAVLSHRTGRRDIVVYRRDDPDTAAVTVALSEEEANAVAELLGTTRVVERLAEIENQVQGVVAEQVVLPSASRYDSRPLADTQTRTRTAASIVAVVRAERVTASPRPDFVLQAGDVVVLVGSAAAVASAASLLTSE